MLLHVVDASGEGNKPLQDYQTLMDELAAYNEDLRQRAQLIVLNKIDLISSERLEELQRDFARIAAPVLAISAQNGTGLDALKDKIKAMLARAQTEDPA